jgi:transposase InsO family protein
MRFKFIHAEKVNHSVTALCRVMLVATSGYYAWARRPESTRAKQDILLRSKVRASHAASRRTYGSPRVHVDLRAEGFGVGRKKVARLMREEGLQGRAKRGFQRTTDSNHDLAIAPNTLDRNFAVDAPNTAWVTDITYVHTWEGWLYVSVIVDLFSRRVVGWSADEHMRTELVTSALQMALGRRCPQDGLLHHSDRGSQYASGDYRQQLWDNGIVCSMSRKANCWDNAVAESFFATIKKELIHRHPWPTRLAARDAIANYIEMFYNPHRRHSALGYVSPAEFERCHQPTVVLAA